jgi:hypothetical protein
MTKIRGIIVYDVEAEGYKEAYEFQQALENHAQALVSVFELNDGVKIEQVQSDVMDRRGYTGNVKNIVFRNQASLPEDGKPRIYYGRDGRMTKEQALAAANKRIDNSS